LFAYLAFLVVSCCTILGNLSVHKAFSVCIAGLFIVIRLSFGITAKELYCRQGLVAFLPVTHSFSISVQPLAQGWPHRHHRSGVFISFAWHFETRA
jgi:hypothetical protein